MLNDVQPTVLISLQGLSRSFLSQETLRRLKRRRLGLLSFRWCYIWGLAHTVLSVLLRFRCKTCESVYAFGRRLATDSFSVGFAC